MTNEASEALLDDACQPRRVYQYVWAVGDIVVWDNRCLMRRARPFDTDHPRVLRASRISGGVESELAPTFADARAAGRRLSMTNESALAG